MNIAYLVLAHSDPSELHSLCDRLSGRSDIYIHINKKSNISIFENKINSINNQGRIVFIEKRVRVHWGGWSIVKAAMNLLEEALSKKSYDRLILLTGQDYPIKSDAYIDRFFSQNKDKNYLCVRKLDKESHKLSGYIQCRDLALISKIISFFIKFFPELRIIQRKDYYEDKGRIFHLWGISPKWAITGECARYVLDFYKNNKGFNSYFKYSHSPDDFYFATVIMNSEYENTVNSNHNLFYTHWLPDNNGAKTLDSCDYYELLNSKCLFAKKFSSHDSKQLIEMLEADGGIKGN